MSIVYLLQAIGFIYISFLFGELFLKLIKISPDSLIKKLVFKIFIGFILLGNIGLVFLLLGIFKEIYFYLLGLLIAALSIKVIAAHFKYLISKNFFFGLPDQFKAFFSQHFILKFIILIWLLFYFFISFLPSATGGDALAYHLPFSIEMIRSSSISFPVMNMSNYGSFPLFAEIFFAIQILLFKNFISFKVVQFLIFILLFLLLLEFCFKQMKNKYLIFLFLALLLSNMPFIKLALVGGLIDLYVFAFGIISFLILIYCFVDRKIDFKDLAVSAMFLGAALSIKYIGIFFAFINLPFLFYLCLFTKNRNFKHIFKVFIIYFGIVFLVCGFWYVKNYIIADNPFHPFLSDFEIGKRQLSASINDFVVERNFLGFLMFPFLFFGKSGLFKLPYAMFTAFSFLSAYLLFIFLFLKKKLSIIAVILLLFIELYLLMLFFFSHQIRFAVPALIFAALLLVFLLDALMTYLDFRFNNFSLKIKKYFIFLFVIVSVVLFGASVQAFNKEAKCLIGKTDKNVCLSDIALGDVYVMDYINKNLKNEMILDYWNIYFIYNLKNNNHYLSDYCSLDKLGISDENIKNCLEKSHIKHLIDDARMRGVVDEKSMDINNMRYKIPIVDYFIKNGTVVFEIFDQKFRKDYIRLYKLKD